MNIFTGIMLIFALIGFGDKVLKGRWGLSEHFDKGLATMGTMVIPIVGVCTIGTEFIRRHVSVFEDLLGSVPIDPSMPVGVVLAPDLGGYFIAREIAASPEILIMNGVVLGTLLGQAVCFQLPVFLSSVNSKYKGQMLKGFLVGITMVPVGMVAAQLILRMDMILFALQFGPILVLCIMVALGLYAIPEKMVRGFMVIGRLIQIGTYLMFAMAAGGIFIPELRYASMESVEEALLIVFKSAVIISGSLVLAQIVMRVFRRQIDFIAQKLGTNRISIVAILMGSATSLAILPVFDKMDDKGRLLNSAYSISGAYVFGGSMAFVSAVASGYVLLIFIVSKLVSGFLSMYIVHRMSKRQKED